VTILNANCFHSGGFEKAFHKMQDDGLWTIQKLEEMNYMTELVRPGRLLVASKQ
jgi:hypothetical protein